MNLNTTYTSVTRQQGVLMKEDKPAKVHRCFNLDTLEEGYAITYQDLLTPHLEPLQEPQSTFSINQLKTLGLGEGMNVKRLCALSAVMRTSIFISDEDLKSNSSASLELTALFKKGYKENEVTNASVVFTRS